MKPRLRLKCKKEHAIGKNQLKLYKSVNPYTQRTGPELPITTGVSVCMTKNSYCSLWQGKASPVTQNMKFLPCYAEISLYTACITFIRHPSGSKAVYHHVYRQKAWMKPNQQSSLLALLCRLISHTRGGHCGFPPPWVGWERTLCRLALVLLGTLKFTETKKPGQIKTKDESERQEVKMNVIVQDNSSNNNNINNNNNSKLSLFFKAEDNLIVLRRRWKENR